MTLCNNSMTTRRNEEMCEEVLEDDYPVYYTYWYVVGEEPRRSPIEGNIRDLKKAWKVDEIKRCDAIKRKLPLYGI